MLKARNVFITFIITYLIIMFVSIFIEASRITDVADDVNMTVRMASKMALRQSQSVDDAWSETSGTIMWDSADKINMNIKVAEGNTFVEKNMMDYAFNTVSVDKNSAFNNLFGTKDFMQWVSAVGCKPTQTYRNISTKFNGKKYVEVPKVLNMGVGFLWGKSSLASDMLNNLRLNSAQFNSMSDKYYGNVAGGTSFLVYNSTFFNDYNMMQTKKTSSMWGSVGENSYYVTPSNLGLTYINEELTSMLFINNLDMIMRAKYDGELTEYEGIPTNTLTSTQDSVIDSDIINSTYINNGKFAIEKGVRVKGTNGLYTYANAVSSEYRNSDALGRYSNVDVEYKVIDMYDSANDEILISLYGKSASQLKASDTMLDTYKYYETGVITRPDHRYVIVAFCTFKVDVCVPYMMPTMRDWAMIFNDSQGSNGNYVDLKRTSTDNGMRYEYTTMFAVS